MCILNFDQKTNLRHAFDVREGDIFGCVADVGWTVGHYVAVYGNLLNGTTSTLFESLPNYPDPGRYWSMVEKHKVKFLIIFSLLK